MRDSWLEATLRPLPCAVHRDNRSTIGPLLPVRPCMHRACRLPEPCLHRHGLPRKRNAVIFPHSGFLGRDGPERPIQVDFIPAGMAQHEDMGASWSASRVIPRLSSPSIARSSFPTFTGSRMAA